MASKSGSWSIGWVSFSYSTSWWKTTYNVWWKSYSSAQSAANAIKSSSWYDSSKWLVRWSSSSSSSSWWSSGWSSSSKNNTSYNFVDPSVLHDAQINWLSREQIDAKWWTWTSNAIDAYDKQYNSWWQTSREYWASRSSWWWGSSRSSWWSSVDNAWAPWKSADATSISTMQFWQWTSDDYQKARNSSLWTYYSNLGKLDYNTIYNDLSKNSWFASASENDKRSTVSRIMEQAANAKWWTLTWESEEQIAAEQSKWDDEDIDYINDVINWIDEEWTEEPNMADADFDELLWDYLEENYGMSLDDIWNLVSSNTQSNVVKTSVPEERDTSYDYNTYYKENLAPDNNVENWESKNTLNEQPQVTLVSQYQEPVSTALNDLGLLSPNEAVTNDTPNAEEPDLPKGYENWEDIVTDFENQLQALWSEEGTGLTPQAVAQTYSDFKNQLVQYANNNKLSKEEYEALLAQLKNNEILQNVLVNK